LSNYEQSSWPRKAWLFSCRNIKIA